VQLIVRHKLNPHATPVALQVVDRSAVEPGTPLTPTQRVLQALAQVQEPVPVQQLQKLCGMRTAKVCSALTELSTKGQVVRDARGYQLKLPLPVSRPIDPQENGNGKSTLCSSGG
jgi:predicted Rossmann fold nucleotide-binding protein DprA/Smf involved in DNA uptake